VARGGKKLHLGEIAELAKEGDRIATSLFTEMLDRFGRALSFVVNILDPEVIVLGGGVSNLDVLYTEGIEALARWTFNDELLTRVVKNELGDSAGVLGASLLKGW
jgi:fructokinase